MDEIKLGAMVRVPYSILPKHLQVQAQADLFLEAQMPSKFGFGSGDEAKTVVLFEDQGDCLAVPRQYAAENWGDLLAEHGIVDETSWGKPAQFDWVGDAEHDRRAAAVGQPDWGERQRRWVQTLHDELLASPVKGGIGQAPTSFGKTVCAMKLLSMLGRTALVVVHRDFQIGQWKKAARDWLGLTEADMGIVKEKKCEFAGRKLVFAMVETLVNNLDKYPPEFFEAFGVIIADEVHRYGAPEWSKAMPRFPARIRVGISATPRRKDGLDKVFRWTIGPVLAKETEWYVKATVYQVGWPAWVPIRDYAMVRHNRVTGEEEVIKIWLAKLITILSELPKYNRWLVDELKQAAEKGRTILVLSDRREQLTLLKEAFDQETGGKYPTGYFWGETKKSKQKQQEEEADEKQVLFGTFGKAKEALNIQALDTLYLTTPRADIEQDLGRILRIDPNKKPPLVVDVVHVGVPTAEDFGQKRAVMYRQLKHEVRQVGKWQ